MFHRELVPKVSVPHPISPEFTDCRSGDDPIPRHISPFPLSPLRATSFRQHPHVCPPGSWQQIPSSASLFRARNADNTAHYGHNRFHVGQGRAGSSGRIRL